MPNNLVLKSGVCYLNSVNFKKVLFSNMSTFRIGGIDQTLIILAIIKVFHLVDNSKLHYLVLENLPMTHFEFPESLVSP